MSIETAIQWLHEEYERARKNPTVRNPLAFALYHVWRRVDSAGKREEKG